MDYYDMLDQSTALLLEAARELRREMQQMNEELEASLGDES